MQEKSRDIINNIQKKRHSEEFALQPCFKIGLENHHPLCLKLEQANGSIDALEYSYLTAKRFYPEKGIVLIFQQAIVSVYGSHLEILFEQLNRHKVTAINIDKQHTSPTNIDQAIVTKIDVVYHDSKIEEISEGMMG